MRAFLRAHAPLPVGPSLIPDDPETRAVAALATRVHDLYLVPVQAGERKVIGLQFRAAV